MLVPAPNFTLPDQKNRPVSLKDFFGKWVILYAYPKDNTPGCTKEACDFSENYEDFERIGAKVMGISPDTPESHREFIEQHSLTLDLLSDPAKEVLTLYGAFGIKKNYGKEYLGVIRSTFLIDPEGYLIYSWKNIKVPGHAASVLTKLKSVLFEKNVLLN